MDLTRGVKTKAFSQISQLSDILTDSFNLWVDLVVRRQAGALPVQLIVTHEVALIVCSAIDVGSYQVEFPLGTGEHRQGSSCYCTDSQGKVGAAHGPKLPPGITTVHKDGVKTGPKHPEKQCPWRTEKRISNVLLNLSVQSKDSHPTRCTTLQTLCSSNVRKTENITHPTLRTIQICGHISLFQIPAQNLSDTGSRPA